MENLLDFVNKGYKIKRGDRVIVINDIKRKDGITIAKSGYTGILLSNYIDEEGSVRIRVDGMYYPINYAKAICLTLINTN